MKILYHHRTLADGAEGIHIAEMVEAFTDLGHEVRVCGMAGAPQRPRRQRLIERVRRVLPAAAFEAASVGVNVAEYLEVKRQIRRFRPEFMYKRHARYDIAGLAAARDLGVPVALEVNCLFSSNEYRAFEPMTLGPVAKYMERRALRLANVVLAVSTPLAREIENLACVDAAVLPNSANPRRFDPALADPRKIRAQFGLRSGVIIGWAGVIREWHGLELLLEALAAIPQAQLLLIGDGPARHDVERRAAALGVSDRLVITGRVSHDEMPDYLAAVDIAVVAHDRTGVASPMKLLEYMAMGRAAVAPRLSNITDVVDEGSDALLFEPGDVGSLIHALRQLANDADLRRRLGESAKNKILTTRNWRGNAEHVIALIRRSTR